MQPAPTSPAGRGPAASIPAASIGVQLRNWRQMRRRSQLDLALEAGISQRHLSYVESGRAAPSRAMVLNLAEHLEVPLRDRNALLLAAGFAPRYPQRRLDDPALQSTRALLDAILRGHAPHPALAVDRHWIMVAANAAVPPLLAGVTDAALLRPPVNVLRLSLHPGGLAPAIANLPAWRAHVLARLRRQAQANGDPELRRLLAELAALGPGGDDGASAPGMDEIAVPLELDTSEGRLSLISTTAVFGTAAEVVVSELAIEAFYPADRATADRLARLQRPRLQRPQQGR
ncbi:MAG TPA: helix-turn-helix transcriptional regulator [Acetobacteraceae bacterium]|nr:helix-turn-helix transcriptional regulator [Acetobacteraceae bacterium]